MLKGKLLKIMLLVIVITSISVIPFQSFATPPAPVITNGPYLIDMTDTSVTVMWYTDLKCTATVNYGVGSLTNSAKQSDKGHLALGTRHEVKLTGLTPGTTYNYQVVSREVESYLQDIPTIGETVTGSTNSFTTFDTNKSSYSFYFMTDIKENMTYYNSLLNLIDPNSADFVVYGGDQFSTLNTLTEILTGFINPAVNKFAKKLPIVYARGNCDMRGTYRRYFKDYIRPLDGSYYYGFNQGAAALAVLDTGEDKTDSNSEYAGLLTCESYRAQEYSWLQSYTGTSDFTGESFQIFLQHQPNFGAVTESTWKTLANNAGVDLLLAGGNLTYSHAEPGAEGNDYHKVVVGQNQLAKVTVTTTMLTVTIYDSTGGVVDTITIS